MKKYLGFIIITLALISAFAITLTRSSPVSASGQTISPWIRYNTSTGILVATTSTLVSATSTGRVYLRLSNLASSTIYCNVNGNAATAFNGISIFTNSTYSVLIDENPYRGAFYCIAPSGAASTTLVEELY